MTTVNEIKTASDLNRFWKKRWEWLPKKARSWLTSLSHALAGSFILWILPVFVSLKITIGLKDIIVSKDDMAKFLKYPFIPKCSKCFTNLITQRNHLIQLGQKHFQAVIHKLSPDNGSQCLAKALIRFSLPKLVVSNTLTKALETLAHEWWNKKKAIFLEISSTLPVIVIHCTTQTLNNKRLDSMLLLYKTCGFLDLATHLYMKVCQSVH